MTASKDQAIQLALHGDWEKALVLNQELLLQNPSDFETLNRIAFVYTALRKNKEAIKTYEKVLSLDNQNPIALKNLKRLQVTKKSGGSQNHVPNFAALADTMFIEENGKTKVVELINVAQSHIIAHLMTGEMINLRIKRSKIFVLDGDETFIGMLPDDIGKRLIKFMEGGNTYQACIKAINKKGIIIFIKEVKRAKKFKNQPSFLNPEQPKINAKTSRSSQRSDDAEDEE
jgi:tetratricopeptide (TPR) repeat protein